MGRCGARPSWLVRTLVSHPRKRVPALGRMQFGCVTMSARQNDGQSVAAWATSPHKPQPTQPLVTCATGSVFRGSVAVLTVSVGQPERRIQEWSPVQVSSSMPNRVRIGSFSGGQCLGADRAQSALPFKLAFAFGDNHLESIER